MGKLYRVLFIDGTLSYIHESTHLTLQGNRMTEPERKPESGFINEDGKKLFCRYWNEDESEKLPSTPRGLVFICHGAGEHCLWYNELAENIKQKGYYVFAHDHVGHGQSQGDRVHIEDFKQYTRDVFQHIEMVKKRFSDQTPVFIIGHSMGGAISIVAAMERPKYFTGVILIGPAIVGSPEAASPLKIFVGKIIAKILPQMPVLKLDTKAISRDPAVVKKYEDDPLVYHGGLKARWGVAMLKAMEQMEKGMESIDWNFFVLHGDQDKMCDVRGSKMLFEKAASTDKKLKIYEGHYHQLHSEPEEDKKVVIADILEWLEQHTA